jgi:hypothetical protein
LILIGIIPFANRDSSRGGTVSQIDADAASECKGVIVIGAVGPYSVDIKDVNFFAPRSDVASRQENLIAVDVHCWSQTERDKDLPEKIAEAA